MTNFPLLITIVPRTVEWGPQVAIVMIVCNIAAIALGKLTIRYVSAAPALPPWKVFGGMGWPALLATMSFGHVIGMGAILGLANVGIL